jgi:hypothetical protein
MFFSLELTSYNLSYPYNMPVSCKGACIPINTKKEPSIGQFSYCTIKHIYYREKDD